MPVLWGESKIFRSLTNGSEQTDVFRKGIRKKKKEVFKDQPSHASEGLKGETLQNTKQNEAKGRRQEIVLAKTVPERYRNSTSWVAAGSKRITGRINIFKVSIG